MPVLSLGQQLRLRHLIRQSTVLAEVEHTLGEERLTVVHPDERVIVIPLDTLARQVAVEPVEGWQELVDEYLRRTLHRVRETNGLDGPTEAILDRIYPRLYRADELPDYVRSFGPDLAVALALDEPHFITMLNDVNVARHGLERLREAADANLRAREVDYVVEETEGTYLVAGDEHAASAVLMLPELVVRLTGEEVPDVVVFAVPNQTTLVFHPLHHGDLPSAAERVTHFAKHFHGKGVHPISPHAYVYWVRKGLVARTAVSYEPTLGEEGTARLHELIRASPVLRGREVAIEHDRITVSGTHAHRFLKLAHFVEQLREHPQQEWPEEVDTHLRMALILANDPPAFAEPTETVLAKAYPQLLRPDVKPDPDWWAYARNTVPGVLDVLAIDLIPDGGGVHTFHDDHLRAHGADRVREAAMRNLRQVRAEEHVHIAGVHMLLGGAQMAATALILDEIIQRTSGERELPDGALVAVPSRQLLVYHVPDEGLSDALNRMSQAAAAQEPLESISRAVYWWQDGIFHQLNHFDEDGRIDWRLPPEFAALYRRLCPELPERPPELDGPTEAIIDRIQPMLSSAATPAYAEELAPGLVVALAYHGVVLSDEDVERHGGTDALRGAAWRNFHAGDYRIRVDVDGDTHFVHGVGHLAASALSLSTLATTVTGSRDLSGGVLFGAPNEDTAVLRVLRAGEDVGRAVEALAPIVASLHDESHRRISRFVYRWVDGVLERAS